MLMRELPCLPLLVERHINKVKLLGVSYRNPEVEVYVFPQIWGSTALGFNGIGGQAMTSAYTTVVSDLNEGYHSVFFGEALAYTVFNPNDKFFKDIARHKMRSVRESAIYNSNGGEQDD